MPAKGSVIAMNENPETPPTESVIGVSVTELRVSYGDSLLFDALSLQMPAGAWTCLLGPSGVGKTTLLRVIAGLEQGETGQIVCSDQHTLTGRIAYMAQRDLLLPWLTLTENAMLGARLRGRSGKEEMERTQALLERVGLGSHVNKRPDSCSGGMRQRAAVVRTLMEDRPVVLMDEPFSALDAITRLELQEIAADLLTGRTVLLVTHDPLEALRLGHRIHVMSGSPATMGEPFEPGGRIPRSPGNPEVVAKHSELLERLAG